MLVHRSTVSCGLPAGFETWQTHTGWLVSWVSGPAVTTDLFTFLDWFGLTAIWFGCLVSGLHTNIHTADFWLTFMSACWLFLFLDRLLTFLTNRCGKADVLDRLIIRLRWLIWGQRRCLTDEVLRPIFQYDWLIYFIDDFFIDCLTGWLSSQCLDVRRQWTGSYFSLWTLLTLLWV